MKVQKIGTYFQTAVNNNNNKTTNNNNSRDPRGEMNRNNKEENGNYTGGRGNHITSSCHIICDYPRQNNNENNKNNNSNSNKSELA